MAKKPSLPTNGASLGFEAELFKAADKLRGSPPHVRMVVVGMARRVRFLAKQDTALQTDTLNKAGCKIDEVGASTVASPTGQPMQRTALRAAPDAER